MEHQLTLNLTLDWQEKEILENALIDAMGEAYLSMHNTCYTPGCREYERHIFEASKELYLRIFPGSDEKLLEAKYKLSANLMTFHWRKELQDKIEEF